MCFMKKLIIALSMTLSFGMVSGQQEENRGFVHPGGLHTQSDFDRIKS